ncbi:MAG: C10 family peptidase [Prevotella sp.]|nr:C10 family peptidase [Prevotella sp.]
MKRLRIILILLCVSLAVFSAGITPQQALETARDFMQQRKGITTKMRRAPLNIQMQQAETGLQVLYAFNVEGGGFVIASGDDRTLPVLGYSLTGSIDTDNMPDNMRSWLQGYADDIAHLSKSYNASTPSGGWGASQLAPVPPMLKTTWYQEEPYNLMAPVYDGEKYDWEGKRSVTGCVATAMAQVMYYHQWPQEATTTIPSYTFNYREEETCTLPELPATTFKWDQMLPNYTEENPGTEEQRMAVAELMRYCGQATKMDYTPDGAGTQHEFIANALRRYFGYSQGIYCANWAEYTIAGWRELIWSELDHKRPVLFAGQSSGGGHEFVIDGYDGNDMFHVNWGWGGKNDGYFAINVLNPKDNTSVGSASSTVLGFATDQQILVGVERSTGKETVVPEVVKKLMVFNELIALDTVLVYMASYVDFELRESSYYMGLGIKNADGSCQPVVQNDEPTSYINGLIEVQIYPTRMLALPDGDYTLYPIAKDAGEPGAEWEFIGAPSECFSIEVKDATVNVHPAMNLKIVNAYFEKSPATPLDYNTLLLVVENQGDKEVSTVTQLKTGKTVDQNFVWVLEASEALRPTQLYPGERATLRYPMEVPFKGDLEIELLDMSGKVTLDKTVVNIENEPHFFDLQLTDYMINYAGWFDISAVLYIKNNDTRTWAEPYNFSMKATIVGEEGLCSGTNSSSILPGQTLELDVSELDGIFATVENIGDMHIIIGTSYGKFYNGDNLLDIIVKPGTTVTPAGVITAIDDIKAMDNGQLTIDNGIYDLCGRRVSGQPRKGIYIKNKKIVNYSH